MKRKPKDLDQDRRRFLRDLAVASGAITVASAPAQAGAASPAASQPAVSRRGYRLTAHVSKYYEKARI